MGDELHVSLHDNFYKCGGAATALPSSGRGWPAGPGDGLLFVRRKLMRGCADTLQVSLRDESYFMPAEPASELCMATHTRLASFHS